MLCYRDVRTSHCEHFSKLKSRDYHGPLGRRNGGNNALDKATIQQKVVHFSLTVPAEPLTGW